jgi:hypothetical protein
MKSRLHREVLVLDGHDINELNIVSVIPSIRTIDFIRVDCSRSTAQGNQLPGLITSRSTVNDRLLSRLSTVSFESIVLDLLHKVSNFLG